MPLGIPNFVSNLFSGLKKAGTGNVTNTVGTAGVSQEDSMEEAMDVDPLDISYTAIPPTTLMGKKDESTERSLGLATRMTPYESEILVDRENLLVKSEIKEETEEIEEIDTPADMDEVLSDPLDVVKIIKINESIHVTDDNDGNGIIVSEEVLGDLPADVAVAVVVLPSEEEEASMVHQILAPSESGESEQFPIINSETAANVEVMDVVETEVTEEAEVEVSSESVNETDQEETAATMGTTSGTDMEEKETGEEVTQEEFGDENDAESFVEITRRRISQDRDGNCYCGKERNLNIAELLCASCNRWYHESCIGYQLGKLVPFMANYVFICKNCSPTGLESFKRNQAQFTQMCVTALANLTQASAKDGTNRKLFSKDKEIIPFFDMHWEGMTTTTRRVTQSWHSTVTKALQKEVGMSFISEESLNDPDSPYFGLMCSDLTQIRPNYDAMIKGGHLKVTELGVHQTKIRNRIRKQVLHHKPPVQKNSIQSQIFPIDFESGGKRKMDFPCPKPLPDEEEDANMNLPPSDNRISFPTTFAPFPLEEVMDIRSDTVIPNAGSNLIFRGRGAKRRTVGDPVVLSQASVAKKTRGDSFLPKMILGHGYPVDHPYNKDGYRYILAEPDSNAPYRQEFDESSDWAGKPIPGWLYRVLNPCSVLLALHDRAPQLKVSEDRLSVTGEKGYCMIRATHGVTKGCWYWEAKITDMPEGSHTRIGFSQPYGNLQGPLGYDRYGYSWRSRYGTKFHEAKGKSYCKGGYGLGDVLGFLIEMPDTNPLAPSVPQSFKDRPLVRFKSHLYYEDKDDKSQESEPLAVRKDSKIVCFKNGVCQGVAYQDMNEGIYYPAVSLFKGVTVNVNFGPDFWAEPDKSVYHHQGMYERADDAVVQQTLSDLVFLTENHGKLRLENAVALPQ